MSLCVRFQSEVLRQNVFLHHMELQCKVLNRYQSYHIITADFMLVCKGYVFLI